jgi:hypothetical protein
MAAPHNVVCGALRIFFADSSSSNLAIHKVWLQFSSLIRQKISRKSLLPNYAVLPYIFMHHIADGFFRQEKSDRECSLSDLFNR